MARAREGDGGRRLFESAVDSVDSRMFGHRFRAKRVRQQADDEEVEMYYGILSSAEEFQ